MTEKDSSEGSEDFDEIRTEEAFYRENNQRNFGFIYPLNNVSELELNSVDCEYEAYSGENSNLQTTITYEITNKSSEPLEIDFAFGDEYAVWFHSEKYIAVKDSEFIKVRLFSGVNKFSIDSYCSLYSYTANQIQGKEMIVSFENLNKWQIGSNFNFKSKVSNSQGKFIYVMDDYDYSTEMNISKLNNRYKSETDYNGDSYFTYFSSTVPVEPMDYIFEYRGTPAYLPNAFVKVGAVVALNADYELLPVDSGISAHENSMLAEGTRVKILSIDNGDWVGKDLSSWCTIEVLDGNREGSVGKLFGTSFKEIFPLGFSPELIKAFEEATLEYVDDWNQGPIMWNWLENKCNEKDMSSIEDYIELCEKRGYFERDEYTAPNPLLVVIQTGYNECFDAFLKSYPKLVKLSYCTGKYGEHEQTPLYMAVKYNNVHALNKLIEEGEDINEIVSQGVNYSPFITNLISISKSDEVKQILIDNGINLFYPVKVNCKLYPLEGNVVRIYKDPSEDSDFTEYTVTEDTNAFESTEAGFIGYGYEREVPDRGDFVPLYKWMKIKGNGFSGWVKPCETFVSSGIFEP